MDWGLELIQSSRNLTVSEQGAERGEGAKLGLLAITAAHQDVLRRKVSWKEGGVTIY
jgi:hypothetical protein